MDPDQGKLFLGGISWETTEDKLKEHFGNYGEVIEAIIMRDKVTGRPRGFGFVAFADPSLLDRVLQDTHSIDGRTVDAKRALSREEQQTTAKFGNSCRGRAGGASGVSFRTKKIFVGGLPPSLTEDGFRQYFENYGNVDDVVLMYDQNTHRPRGFGFITFETEDAVDRALHKTFHELNGKNVEVKRALPKDANPGSGCARTDISGISQGSGANSDNYDGRTDTNRYMQPQAASGGFPPYGTSGYGAPGYGYGAANNGVAYGGYGVGNYGGGAAGYGGPAGAYGNPNAPAAAYAGVGPGAPRSPWGSQGPTGYGTAGYGANIAYGAAWNPTAGGAGTGAAPAGLPPTGATSYGNQGHGYSGYGGADGSYGNQGGYGAVGGRVSGGSGNNPPGGSAEQGAGPGYVAGGYGDAGGNSGYANLWRSDYSQRGGYGTAQGNGASGGTTSYGGGYGGAQARQVQQQ